MPCVCRYDPPEESKKIVEDACITIINELKKISAKRDPIGYDLRKGDPIGHELRDVKELLDHLWHPKKYPEAKKIEDK